METITFTAPLEEGFSDPRLTLTVFLCKNKEDKNVMQVHNSLLLTKEAFPKLVTAVIGSYLIDMKGQKLITDAELEGLEAKILDEVSTLITTMKPERTIYP